MLQYISEKSTNLLIRHRIIETEQKEVYLYGFQLFYSTFITAFVIIMTSLLFKTVLSGFIFIGYFAIPRFYVGGYHAPTYGKCFLFTNTLFLCELLLTQLIIIHKTFYLTLFFMLFIFCNIFICCTCQKNKFLFKKTVFLLLSFEILLYVMMSLLPISTTYSMIAMESTISTVILILISKIKRREHNA